MQSLIVITVSKKTLINFSATTLIFSVYVFIQSSNIRRHPIFNIKTKPSHSQKQKNQATLFCATSLDVQVKE